MYVTEAQYNANRRGWDYRLKDVDGHPYREWVKEINLEDPD